MKNNTKQIYYYAIFFILFPLLVNSNNQSSFISDSVFNKVQYYLSTRNITAAEIVLDSIKQVIDKNTTTKEFEANYYRYQGKVFYFKREYQKSILSFNNAIILFEQTRNNDSILAYLYNNIGAGYYLSQNYSEAILNLEKSIQIKKAYFEENSQALASSYNNLGLFYKKNGNYLKALNNLTKAEKIMTANGETTTNKFASILNNKANLFRLEGKNEEAIVYFKYTIEIFEQIGDKSAKLTAENNLANVFLFKKEYQKALEIYKQILNHELFNSRFEKPYLYNNIALCYKNTNEYNLAQKYFKLALNTAKNTTIENIQIYLNLSELNLKLNKGLKAKQYALKAIDLSKQIEENDNIWTAKSYNILADYYEYNSDYKLAVKYSNNALQLLENNRLYSTANIFTHLNILAKKGKLLFEIGKSKNDTSTLKQSLLAYQKAAQLIQNLHSALNLESNRLWLVERRIQTLHEALAVAFLLYENTQNREYVKTAFYFSEMSKSAALNASLNKARALIKGNVPDSLIQKERQLTAQISVLESQEFNNSFDLLKLYQEHESLLAFFEDNYPKYFSIKHKPLIPNLISLKSTLNYNEFVIEYTLTNNYLYAFYIQSDTVMLTKQSVDSSFFRDLFFIHNFVSYNPWIENNSEYFTQYQDVAYKLFDILLGEVQQDLIGKNVTIIPDAELSFIPFEALLTNPKHFNDYSSLPYLLHLCPINYKYSAQTFKYNTQQNTESKKLAAIAPNYKEYSNIENSNIRGKSFKYLKGAMNEIQQIAKIFKVDKYIGDEATVMNFKNVIKDYDIVHLAMHADLNKENPLFSKLIFASNDKDDTMQFLNVYEIYNLNIKTNLLVLSACNTYAGSLISGEGIMSIARSFINAGCNNLITTLWDVNDNAGSKLMQQFYKQLSMKQTSMVSLQKAKINYLNNADPLKKHPFYWAGFVNLGNTDKIFITNKINRNVTILSFVGISILVILFAMTYLLIKYFQQQKS